jgi:hypothetical protein
MSCFWEAPWLNGEKSKYIAPLILMISTRTKWNIKTALHENGWVSKIKMEDLIIVYILSNLWNFLPNFKQSIWLRALKTTSFGLSRQVVNIWRLPHTRLNTLVQSPPTWEKWLGIYGTLLRPCTSCGLLSKIGFRRRTDECIFLCLYIIYH